MQKVIRIVPHIVYNYIYENYLCGIALAAWL